MIVGGRVKTIGLIGGMSWESTVTYYQLINQRVKLLCGGLHSAKIVLHSVDFHEIEQYHRSGEWELAGNILTQAAGGLVRAGADFLVLCTNTMHKVAPQIEASCSIPLLHIADVTAAKIKSAGFSSIGLLGTRFTMEQEFYVDRLRERHGLNVLVPDTAAREQIHRIIYEELCLGQVEPSSRRVYQQAIAELARRGAQGVVFGCTEISMLVGAADSPVPVFDTTQIHADAAVDRALEA